MFVVITTVLLLAYRPWDAKTKTSLGDATTNMKTNYIFGATATDVPLYLSGFLHLTDRNGRQWCIRPHQIVSIEPEEKVGSFGTYTNGCFIRVSTGGFPIRMKEEAFTISEWLSTVTNEWTDQ
jgi:hypothetical protein